MIQIYHNSRCSKSRECLKLLANSDLEFEIIRYLETPPTFEELDLLLTKLGIKPEELIRKKEKLWIDKFKDREFTDHELTEIMVSHPILIERPIIIKGNKAIIARPIEKTLELLEI